MKLSVNEAKLSGLWAKNCATIQQVLILKYAFGLEKLLCLSRNGPHDGKSWEVVFPGLAFFSRLLSWFACSHDRCYSDMGIPINSQNPCLWASPSNVTLAIWVRVRLQGYAYITEGFENGDAQIAGIPTSLWHCPEGQLQVFRIVKSALTGSILWLALIQTAAPVTLPLYPSTPWLWLGLSDTDVGFNTENSDKV